MGLSLSQNPPTMRCPGCSSTMQHQILEGVLGTSVDVGFCLSCRAFWFEPFETLHLTRSSTLKLFAVIADQATAVAASPVPNACYCPKCNSRLLLTHDRQHTTPFQYWRCDLEHGRFTSFVDFLREKDFIRPLSPQQIAELRQNIQVINCSNCGAPIDLTKDSACGHCGSPLSMLDTEKMMEMAKSDDRAPDAGLALEHGEVAALFALRESSAGRNGGSSSSSLVDLGLQAVAHWLRDLMH
jgi:DNA-directed RNA polymerase subunit RPC12/RpoP